MRQRGHGLRAQQMQESQSLCLRTALIGRLARKLPLLPHRGSMIPMCTKTRSVALWTSAEKLLHWTGLSPLRTTEGRNTQQRWHCSQDQSLSKVTRQVTLQDMVAIQCASRVRSAASVESKASAWDKRMSWAATRSTCICWVMSTKTLFSRIALCSAAISELSQSTVLRTRGFLEMWHMTYQAAPIIWRMVLKRTTFSSSIWRR